ncbi:MAG: hypothetical protein C4B59_03140 [Candidatus Methanogaster sp.]|uniref:Uncharacterized protein n=1 Tax=Candidatus Methanogaster sp. TaxID=3386292 RepID=A0AC61L5N6_9EURY|nr:MAG: hypothetical protein C4B59_03140 [ANME-2 cluster archaeon]
MNISASNLELVWGATNFAAFWHDLDDNLQSEVLTLEDGVLNEDVDDRTIHDVRTIFLFVPFTIPFPILSRMDRWEEDTNFNRLFSGKPLNRPDRPPKASDDDFFRIEFSEILTGSGNTV